MKHAAPLGNQAKTRRGVFERRGAIDKRSNLISIINAISVAASELILEATRLANVRT